MHTHAHLNNAMSAIVDDPVCILPMWDYVYSVIPSVQYGTFLAEVVIAIFEIRSSSNKPSFVNFIFGICFCFRDVRFCLLGRFSQAPYSNPIRSFAPRRWTPATDQYVRRQGQPAKDWVAEV